LTVARCNFRRRIGGDKQWGAFLPPMTDGARKILEAVCSQIQEIAIDEAGIWIDGNKLEGHEAELLAVSDGFSSLADMFAFWAGRMPFTGDLIHWRRP
jgi:hypothetical protein